MLALAALYSCAVALGIIGTAGTIYSIVKRKIRTAAISVLALLVSLAFLIPPFIPMSEQARQGCVVSNMRLAKLIVDDYRSSHKNLCPTDTILFRLLPTNLKLTRILKTQYIAKFIEEPPSINIKYMLGYATSNDNKRYIILGTDINGQPLRDKNGRIIYLTE